MLARHLTQTIHRASRGRKVQAVSLSCLRCMHNNTTRMRPFLIERPQRAPQHTRVQNSSKRQASGISADTIMEDLNELYATAKDEFEIAAEETEKKTVYASDDREGAREALTLLKEAFSRAINEGDPDVAKEVQSRVGSRIRELENAIIAMEESAMQD